jgi:hypothetical protein
MAIRPLQEKGETMTQDEKMSAFFMKKLREEEVERARHSLEIGKHSLALERARGLGKTTAMLCDVVERLLAGFDCIVWSVTHAHGRYMLDRLVWLLEYAGIEYTADPRKAKVELDNGRSVMFRIHWDLSGRGLPERVRRTKFEQYTDHFTREILWRKWSAEIGEAPEHPNRQKGVIPEHWVKREVDSHDA